MLLSVSHLIFPLITFPYASRILGPQGMGAVSFIDSITQYFILFAALGVPLYGIREISRCGDDQEKRNRIFSEILVIHLAATVLFSIVYAAIAFNVTALQVHWPLVAVGIASMYFNVFAVEWFYQGTEQFVYITRRTLLIRLLTVVILFVFLKPGSDPVVYSVIFVSAILMNAIINVIMLRKHVRLDFRPAGLTRHIRPLVLIFGSAVTVSVYTLMDNVLLGFIKNETAVGIYSTSLKIVRIPFTLIAAIGAVILPQVSRAFAEQQRERVNELINKSFAFTCIVGLPIVSGLFVSAGFLVSCFAGPAFAQAADVIRILCPVVMLIGMNSLLATQLLAPMGMERQLLVLAVICMIFSLCSNFILIPLYSFNGAAVTNVFTEALLVGMLWYSVRKAKAATLNTRIFFQCLTVAILFVPIALGIRLLDIDYMVREMVIIVACGLFYCTCLLVFIENEHIKTVSQFMLSKLSLQRIKN